MRDPAKTFEDLILAHDLDYGDVSELKVVLVEVSKLLVAYSQATLNSDS